MGVLLSLIIIQDGDPLQNVLGDLFQMDLAVVQNTISIKIISNWHRESIIDRDRVIVGNQFFCLFIFTVVRT